MGNEFAKIDPIPPIDEGEVSGLLSLDHLNNVDTVENLIFGSGGIQVFSYFGAIRVLEKTSILKNIKRFSGAGAGAIVAALLALGFDSRSLQEYFDQSYMNLSIDNEEGKECLVENLVLNYGWISGQNFLAWFATVLESKSFKPDVTFSELYSKTGKELCIILTNIDKVRTEFFHPKTTPDFEIRRAIFASISVPVMFMPLKFGNLEKSHYVHGGLMCSYPIKTYDGWWLSMNSEDSFIKKFDSSSALASPYINAFKTRSAKSLGFLLIDKYEGSNYQEFLDRLKQCDADMTIPDTELGIIYKSNRDNRMVIARNYDRLRSVSLRLIDIITYCQDEFGCIREELLAEKIWDTAYFNRKERLLISPECEKSKEDCIAFLKRIANDGSLNHDKIMDYIKLNVLSLLERNPSDSIDIKSLHIFFRSVFEVKRRSGVKLSHADFNRTVGIFCGHIGSDDDLSSKEDRIFLYRQGWNATVAHLEDLND